MSADLEQRIANLEAREQIKELRAVYGWHAARGERDKVASLFTADGVFELNAGGGRRRIVGRAAILEFLQNSMWPDMVFPLLHNHVIDVDGDQASGTCAMQALAKGNIAAIYPDGFAGYYHDRLRRQPDGSWQFAERRWFLYHPEFEDSGLPVR